MRNIKLALLFCIFNCAIFYSQCDINNIRYNIIKTNDVTITLYNDNSINILVNKIDNNLIVTKIEIFELVGDTINNNNLTKIKLKCRGLNSTITKKTGRYMVIVKVENEDIQSKKDIYYEEKIFNII